MCVYYKYLSITNTFFFFFGERVAHVSLAVPEFSLWTRLAWNLEIYLYPWSAGVKGLCYHC